MQENSPPINSFRPISGVEVTGAKSFHIVVQEKWIERTGNMAPVDSQVLLVSNRDRNTKALLPVPPLISDNPFSFDDFEVSPDEKVIIASRKICSGTNETFVFLRHSPLFYRLADTHSLHDRITHKYGKRSNQWGGGVQFLTVKGWQKHGRLAILSCHYGDRASKVYYTVLLDTHTGALHDFRPAQDE